MIGALPVGVREFVLMGRKAGYKPSLYGGVISGWVIMLCFIFQSLGLAINSLPWFALAVVAAIIYFSALLFEQDLSSALVSQAITLMSVLYLGLGLGFQIKLLMIHAHTAPIFGWQLILALYLIVWMGDSTAYFVGNFFGRHKLAPRVSPKKTWEGAFGNLLGNIMAAFIIKITIFNQSNPFLRWSLVDTVSIALLLGVIGQLGDLVESSWKRSANIKDSDVGGGIAIPGHGGLLDRIDSLVLAAPAFCAYLYFVWRLG
jgi:phosphatidate cytidylyltransferase